jgi:hypothetical protein
MQEATMPRKCGTGTPLSREELGTNCGQFCGQKWGNKKALFERFSVAFDFDS